MAPTLEESQPGQESRQFLALAKGFNALLEAAKQLTRQEQLLRSRLQSAHDEYLRFSSQLAETSTTQQAEAQELPSEQDAMGRQGENGGADTTEWVQGIEGAGYLSRLDAQAVMEASEIAKAVAERHCQQDESHKSSRCPFAKLDSGGPMEKDFTTVGTKGNLHCPFAKSNEHASAGGLATVNEESEKCGNDLDPIKAEFHPDAPPCVTGSTRSATSRCPIRYLNAHTPEEIAEFFQKHKHEIPRSHSICIQRYQKDPQNLRQLDEKYGDVVNMVKGLGVYHQPYLPSSPLPEEEQKHETEAAERVERWAEDVSNKSPNAGVPPSNIIEDDIEIRGNHFERSLRDVRVGESPSRPWGIHVPIAQETAQSVVASLPVPAAMSNWSEVKESVEPSHPIPTPLGNEGESPSGNGRCPFGHHAAKESESSQPVQPDQPFNEARPNITDTSHAGIPDSSPRSPQPRIVFNGPVIFGYSGESVALFLEKLGQLGKL
ncbi:predicted protein [Uncinocarpus reesii 1704]|uniref:Uncharacterized protein n=1 Tax=Uncinocarpus reesii (strain UAMH 1704) TaxID=336963 RepID=C4JKE1_UNCRE|nr:uncharacterized protein UREG_02098 [Uncinocarpus reesii 1704]EEP77249.1 predicted protein [Uncinocarpus reesii 1704]